MAPPSPLSIATSAVQRLVKEEASYHRELKQQQQRIQRLESETGPDEEGNREYSLKQERLALEETKAVFPTLKSKISAALQKLEALLVEEGQKGDQSNVEQIDAAKDAVSQGKTALREVS